VDFLHRGNSEEASMGGIVVVGMVRMLKRIVSFLLVSVGPAYRLNDIILSAGESTCPIQETGKEVKTRVLILCVQSVWIILGGSLYGQDGGKRRTSGGSEIGV